MSDDRYSGGGRDSRGGRMRRRRICGFCVDRVKDVDYKQHEALSRYLTEYGRIRPRRQTGTCAKHQRRLATAIKRARHLALLPFVSE